MMCALQEYNCTPTFQSSKTEDIELNIKYMKPQNQISDHQLLSNLPQRNLSSFQPYDEFITDASPMLDEREISENIVSSVLGKDQNTTAKNFFQICSENKPYIENVHTSGEVKYHHGNKPLQIAHFHNSREAESICSSPDRTPLSKRSISDYYLSKNFVIEPDISKPSNAAEKLNGVKATYSAFFEPEKQVLLPVHKFVNCGKPETNCVQLVTASSNSFLHQGDGPEAMNILSSNKSDNSLHSYQQFPNVFDCDPGVSERYTRVEPTEFQLGCTSEKSYNKNYNLNPTVNLTVFDTESLSEAGDVGESGVSMDNDAHQVLDDAWFIPSARHTFNGAELSGSASAAQLSIASSFGDSSTPTCKICHMAAKPDDPLISPCRCTGTLRYIHCGCLMRWLEICNKRSRRPPTCELCKYQFQWHKKFKVRHWQFPHCSWRDKILHTVFLISVMVMIGCAIVTVMCFKQHRGNKADLTHLELTQSEIITLICGALFFLAFFLAMYVEIKARNTIYKLMVKFIYLNQQWYIDEYDKKGENTVIDV